MAPPSPKGGTDAAVEHRAAEGQITRRKLVKRQGHGRRGLDTPRRRFSHAA
jgi:transposase